MSTTTAAAGTTGNAFSVLQSGTATSTTPTANEAGSADRFLKLLVTQLQNQDPLNPMDNAQITSQMAQINTVNGIQTLNTTVSGLNGQFLQMQALQGASLVGHDITLKGNRLDIASGTGTGGFELASTADRVKVEIIGPNGRVAETLELGAENAGRHQFDWKATNVADGAPYTFKVTATSGTNAITSTALMRDRVQAVSNQSGSLVLQTQYSGDVAYTDVQAVN